MPNQNETDTVYAFAADGCVRFLPEPLATAASAHDLLWEPRQMPWTRDDAKRHTHKATTWALKELWAKVANECLERTGDEGRAIREANAVIARQEAASC
jgi:hypothetical protein